MNFRLSVLDLTRGHAHQKEGQTARFQRTQRTELLTSSARSTLVLQRKLKFKTVISKSILVPRAYDPSGLLQGSRARALSNIGSPQFTDFPSLCACFESSLTNLIGFGLNLLCLQIHSKPECRWTWPEVAMLGADRSAASGDENVRMQIKLRVRAE